MSSQAQKTVAEQLATPVQFLKGVGPQRAELLARLDLHTARDVLFFFPRDYQDLTELQSFADLEEGQLVRLRGTVLEVDHRGGNGKRHMLGVLVDCGSGRLRALWFNQPFLVPKFRVGQDLLLVGRPRFKGGIWELSHPTVQWIESEEQSQPGDRLLPVYPLTQGLTQPIMRRVARGALDAYLDILDEVFPPEYLAEHQLAPLREALEKIHFPGDRVALEHARRRLVYQELLVLQLALAIRRQQSQVMLAAPRLEATPKIDARIRRLFPFELTAGQQQAIAELQHDMARPFPMTRLLQGDVGSGKTAVAVYAMLLAVAHGQQAVLLAPTEVLARQHARTLTSLLTASRVRWELLTGGLPQAKRKAIVEQIAAGQLDVVIGTHAVLQEDVEFTRLGLVVIDEQHKFGVRQRAHLKQAGLHPHYLVMTATPIPRTIGMTLFGDLDTSTIRDAPPGRQTVHTYLAAAEQRARWWDFFCRKLREGRQGYVIVPLVEESEDYEATSAAEAFEALANGPLEPFRLGMMHGRMSGAEKEDMMLRFARGEVQVLVATTVVEVGVDVPNATLMTIEDGDRFGLAQLHQLRGRVSRGTHPGYCTVFADDPTEEAKKRLEAFIATTDGFELAELDFKLRGPGDLLGTKQHGLPPLRIADLSRDQQSLEEARADAQKLVAADPGLARPEHQRLRKMMLVRYSQVLELGDVG